MRVSSMRSLRSLVGEMVIARIPAINTEEMTRVRLHAVETNGVWIESQEFIEAMMRKCGLATSKTTLLMFVPYQGVHFILSSIDAVSLSEEALGLRDKNPKRESR